eukprot:1002996_1
MLSLSNVSMHASILYMLFRTVFALSIADLQQFQSDISCGETVFNTINNTINPDETHIFRLTTNNTYNVKFHSCHSNTDIIVVFTDPLVKYVSNESCPALHECGFCDNMNNYAENFTMNALEAGDYFIWIQAPFDEGGDYEFEVNCDESSTLNFLCPQCKGRLHCGDYEFEVNCDESSTLNFLCPQCKGRLHCGDDKHAISRTQKGDYYYFNLSNDSTVSFSSCRSSFDTVFTLYDMELSPLYDADDEGPCRRHAVLALNELLAGEYVLRIGGYEPKDGYGSYILQVTCLPVFTGNKNDTYKMLENPLSLRRWPASEIRCRDTYGTSLATIITDDGVSDALYAVYTKWPWYQIEYDIPTRVMDTQYVDFWIGLYRNIANDSEWQWMDGTTCNYTAPNKCIDALHWDVDEPNIVTQKYQTITLLRVYLSANPDNISVALRDEQVITTTNEPSANFSLCNNPNGKHSELKCKDRINCWVDLDCCNSSIILSDIADADAYNQPYLGVRTRFPMIVWKSKIFIVGMNSIHYTNIDSIDAPVIEHEWNHILYNRDDLDIELLAQMYVQHDSSLYLYATNRSTQEEVLLDINLIDFTVNSRLIQSEEFRPYVRWDQFGCMVASANKVYVFRASELLIYDLYSGEWTRTRFNAAVPTACAITDDELFIYIFVAYYVVLKYDTAMDTTEFLDTPNLCVWKQGFGIRARNDKIYMHGCDVGSWKTMVFDVRTEQFDLETINIANPVTQYMPWYAAGVLSEFDDNVLLLLHQTRPDLPTIATDIKPKSVRLYYAVTDLVSVNFEDTEIINSTIWPSDGFIIKYSVNDFSESTNGIYNVWFYSPNAKSNINTSIVLNTTNDHCICHEISYKCSDCHQYFDLSKYLSVVDNDMDELQFSVIPDNSEDNVTLIIPDHISMNLERCVISLTSLNTQTSHDDPTVQFSYNVSRNCYSREDSIFSVNITSSSPLANIIAQVLIEVVSNDSIACSVCSVGDCAICNDIDGHLSFEHDIMETDATLQFFFKSNMIDFAVEGAGFSVEYFSEVPFLTEWQLRSIVAGSVLLLFALIGLTGCWCKTKRELHEEEARRVKYAHDIRNPMVISIGIERYQDKPNNPGIEVRCQDLYGISRDYQNIAALCKFFNWQMYPRKEKLEWTQSEMIDFLQERATEASDTNKFDAILAVISGHGYKNGIISSDYQLVSKTAIHRLFSTNYPLLRELPRIFVFDCCSGNQERSCYPAEYDPNEDEEMPALKDKGKNFTVDDIKVEQYEKEVWKNDQKNPDYLVSIIHAANEGFQAKMNCIDGSYLIYEFVKRIMDNVENDKNLFLGEIVEGIQQYLHDEGTQQITPLFNNNTRYLRFKKSSHDEANCVDLDAITTNENKL